MKKKKQLFSKLPALFVALHQRQLLFVYKAAIPLLRQHFMLLTFDEHHAEAQPLRRRAKLRSYNKLYKYCPTYLQAAL